MLTEFLNRLFSFNGKLELKTPAYQDVLAGDVKEVEQPVIKPKYDDPEIAIVDKYFGPLTDGMIIEVSLEDMLTILPKSRRKSDAYKGLINRIKALGVQLRVASHFESKLNVSKERKN